MADSLQLANGTDFLVQTDGTSKFSLTEPVDEDITINRAFPAALGIRAFPVPLDTRGFPLE